MRENPAGHPPTRDSKIRPVDRILAVDFGTHRVGLAVGNVRDGLAVSLTTLRTGGKGVDEVVRQVAAVARSEDATLLLVGLPLNMDGSEGPAARGARVFGELLSRSASLPVEFADERLTSEAARELARGPAGGRRVKKPIDDLAALVLLQGFLDEGRAREARRQWADPDSGPGGEPR